MSEESTTPVVDSLIEELQKLGIKPKKTRAEMTKQLKKARKALEQREREEAKLEFQLLQESKEHPFDYYLVCDVEGTCDENSGFDHPSEIIEFPVIMLDTSFTEVGRFHRYVRPVLNPILSEFCVSLTGITQDVVDASDTFDVVYSEFKVWLESQIGSSNFNDCIFVTDGPWDLRDFVEKEFTYYQYHRPEYMYRIIDVRKLFVKVTETPSGSLSDMLCSLGMQFEGRQHSGIDDCFNVARVFVELAKISGRLESNTNLRKHKAKRGAWSKLRKPSL